MQIEIKTFELFSFKKLNQKKPLLNNYESSNTNRQRNI